MPHRCTEYRDILPRYNRSSTGLISSDMSNVLSLREKPFIIRAYASPFCSFFYSFFIFLFIISSFFRDFVIFPSFVFLFSCELNTWVIPSAVRSPGWLVGRSFCPLPDKHYFCLHRQRGVSKFYSTSFLRILVSIFL